MRSLDHSVDDLPARRCERQVRIAIGAGAAVAEHRMVEQVKRLQAELQLRTLTKEMTGQRPVFVQREIHIPDIRGVALSDAGLGWLTEDVTVHSECRGVDVLRVVSAVAGLACHQWTNAEIRFGTVGVDSPRISGSGLTAVRRCANQADA